MKRLLMACVMAVASASATAQAAGFANGNFSASGIGLANAYVASGDDVSAAVYNPAALAWQQGIKAMVGMDMRYRNSSVTGTGGGMASNTGGRINTNHLYASWVPRDSNFGLALAFTTPYEMDNDWTDAFGTAAGQTIFKADRLSADVIYSVNSSLALAAGGDFYYSKGEVVRTGVTFKGSDKAAFGGHLSLKWKFAPMWMAGAVFRYSPTVTLTGGAGQQVSVKLPDEIKVGIAHDMADAFRLELDVDWTRWSKLKSMDVTNSAGGGVAPTTLNLNDSFRVAAGLSWYWRQNTQFRFGYAFDQGANDATGYHPAVADQDGHSLALGMGGDGFGVHGDLAFSYTMFTNKGATGAFGGSYRDRAFSLALSISKDF